MKKNISAFLSGSLLLVALSACTTINAQDISLALLAKPSAEAQKEIERALAELVPGQQIKLLDNVFSQKSTISVERTPQRDSRGQLINGRVIEPAKSFSLVKQAKDCYLRDNQTEQLVRLFYVECVTP